MLEKRSFFLKYLKFAIVFCALCVFSSVVSAVEYQTRQTDFDRRLAERSQKYLESVRNRSAELPAERRILLERRAQNVVNTGLAKLKRPSSLIQKGKSSPVDLLTVCEALQKFDAWQNNSSFEKTVAFLNSRFYRPSEWEVAVRVALPARFQWERQFGVLAAHVPFTGTAFDFFGFGPSGRADMIVASSSPRDGKTWAQILGRNSLSVEVRPVDIDLPRFSENVDLLSGFPLIVGTIVLRN